MAFCPILDDNNNEMYGKTLVLLYGEKYMNHRKVYNKVEKI